MAIKSTIYKAALSIADIDHAYYADQALTLARHPSETDERMMIRLAALAFQAHKLQSVVSGDGNWAFGAGLSDPDEPDVLLRDYTNRIRVWIEVGQPEDKPLAKAASKSDEVIVYCFHHASNVWWKGIQNKLTRAEKLSVFQIDSATSKALEKFAERSMQLQATLQDGTLMMSNGADVVEITPVVLL
jgi:uncharacterized protein YaeQ